jgi:hypothetical protein
MNSEILRRTFEIPLSDDRKTVACFARGIAFPYTFAVSVYKRGLFGFHDGALDCPTWRKNIFQLANLLDHDLERHPLDKEGRPDSLYTCYVEKQLLAFMLWNHTTVMGDVEEKAQLDRCEPSSLSKLHVDIFIWKPAKLLIVQKGDVQLGKSWP